MTDQSRWIFPLFNTLLMGIIAYGMGRLLGHLDWWLLVCVPLGFALGLLLEFGTYRVKWLYRVRAWLTAFVQLVIIMVVIAPYIFVLDSIQANPSVICCQTPANFGADYRDVRIPTDDGIELAGWYVPPPQNNDATIIVLHGIGANRLAPYWQAEQLYNAGYGLLLYDQRALGESGGERQSFGWLDIADVSDVVDFVLAQGDTDPDKLGVVGISLGGHIALPAAAKDERIQAVFADGVAAQHAADFPQPQNVAEHVQRFYYGVLDRTLAVQLRLPIEPIIELVPQIAPRPVYLLAGETTQLEARTTARYAAAIGDSAQVWIIPDGGHVNGHLLYPDEYAQRMINFFDAALR